MKLYSLIIASLTLVANLAMANDEEAKGDKNASANATGGSETPGQYLLDQKATLEKFWLASHLDLYPNEKNDKAKIQHLTGEGYEKFIVDASGKWESLQHLAHYYQGDVQFAFINRVLEERLAYTYEVYHEKESFVPRSYYIDRDGKAYAFPIVLPAINTTTSWIDDKKYKNSPFQFKAPPSLGDMKLKWAYVKKEVRLWYQANMLEKVEELLRKTKISYVVDLDPMDFDNSKPYQKMDRQIIFIVGFIGMSIEHLWDWYCAAATPKERKIKKSFMDSSSSAEDVKPSGPESLKKAKKEGKKSEREKID